MSKEFENIDLNDFKVLNKTVKDIKYNQVTGLSNFPSAIDELKKVTFSSTSVNSINAELHRYYELLILYLKDDPSFASNKDEFKSLSETISKYSLTSKDYIAIRDGIIEIATYLKQLSEEEIYGANGVYTDLVNSANGFQQSLEDIVNSVNLHYSQLPDDVMGKIIPDGTINENHLDEELLETYKFLKNTRGTYVDWSLEDGVKTPEGLSKKPIVVKVVK